MSYRGSDGTLPILPKEAFEGRSETVTDAVLTRYSCRNFNNDREVDGKMLREILIKAARAASGGNLQPWKVHVLQGAARKTFCTTVRKQIGKQTPAYDIYPKKLPDPYFTRRGRLGEEMFELMGIARHQKAKRLMAVARNFSFFDAPVGLIITIPKLMGPPQWADLGFYLATLNLLCREAGLHTCNQEAWSTVAPAVQETLNIPDTDTVFCGVAVGYAKQNAPVNQLRAARADPEEYIITAKL